MQVFIIKKNRHYSNLLKIKLKILKNKIKYKILFDESSQYDLKSNDQYDINKLFGISYGFFFEKPIKSLIVPLIALLYNPFVSLEVNVSISEESYSDNINLS